MSQPVLPKIKIPLTKTDKFLEAAGLMALVAFWVFNVYHFKALPDTIPVHFSIDGEPDGYGSKWTIISLPVMGTLFYIGLTIISRFPHKMNYSVTVTEDNAEKQYKIMVQLLRVMKVAMVMVFFILDYQSVQLVLNLPNFFGKYFLLLVFALVFAPVFYFLIEFSKNS